MRAPPLPADRADPAEGRRDARQLRDEAALRQADRDHARARPAEQQVDARRQPRAALPALPPGRGALHAARCSRCSRRTSRGCRSCSAATGRAEPVPRRAAARAGRRRARGGAARPLLSAMERDAPPRRRRPRRSPRALARELRAGDVVTRLRRARQRQDDLRPRRLPRARRDGAGHEPDVHDRPPLPGRAVDVSHLDLYRFQGFSAAEWGDLEPYFDDAICFVEWPEAAAGALPPVRVEVRLSHVDPAHRLITLDSPENACSTAFRGC